MSAAWLDVLAPRISYTWRGPWPPGFVEPWRRLYDHELVIFTTGVSTVVIEGEGEIPCPAGTFLIVPPNRLHISRAGLRPAERLMVHFDWLPVPGPLAPYCVPQPGKLQPTLLRPAPPEVPTRIMRGRIYNSRLAARLLEIIFLRSRSGTLADRAAARGALHELLVHLLASEEDVVASNPAHELALRVKLALDGSLPRAVAVQPLLAGLGYSYAHLCRTFTASYGVPPVRYLNAARMSRAQELMAGPDARVGEVAKFLGFSDITYFSRLYRRHFGIAPSAAKGEKYITQNELKRRKPAGVRA